MSYTDFNERQKFNQWWLWALMAACCLLLIILPLVMGPRPSTTELIILPCIPLIGMLGLRLLRLETQFDKEGIKYRFFPFHIKTRYISWDEIENAEVIKYNPIRDAGGWGIKYGRKGKVYNVSGCYGLHIKFRSGKTLLLGTSQPEELRGVMLKLGFPKPGNKRETQ